MSSLSSARIGLTYSEIRMNSMQVANKNRPDQAKKMDWSIQHPAQAQPSKMAGRDLIISKSLFFGEKQTTADHNSRVIKDLLDTKATAPTAAPTANANADLSGSVIFAKLFRINK
ncbi:MAG: hypothetical protein P1R58_06395 [bacterium]|nr:hypothetical protein [bacterium]